MRRLFYISFLAICLPLKSLSAYVWNSWEYSETLATNGTTRTFRLSVPSDYPFVRGILVNLPGSSGDTRAEYLQSYFEEFLRAHQFAFIGAVGLAVAPGSSESLKVFSNSIPSFVTQSGKPEIANAPFVFIGVSGGGSLSYNIITNNYNKTIAWVSGSGAVGVPPVIAPTTILPLPVMMWAADNDVAGVANAMESFIATNRAFGLRGAYAVMQGSTHTDSLAVHGVGMALLNETIRLSYPSDQCPVFGPITLNRIAEADGWLIDTNTIRSVFATVTNWSAYPGVKSVAHWVPNRDMAYVYRAFASHNTNIFLSTPANESEVNPGANVTITVNASAFAGWTNMAIYSFGTNIANFVGGTPTWTVTNVNSGIHLFSAIATRSGSNVVSRPIMVSVRTLVAPNFACPGNVWYAATNGTAAGTGSISSPWDLQTALDKTTIIEGGDTLYLRGGVYRTNNPSGVSAGNEGYVFRATISGNSTNQILIRSYPGELASIDGQAYGGIYAFHANARPTLQVGTGNTTLGNYLTFQDIEIFSSSTEARLSNNGSNPNFPTDITRSDGPVVHSRGVKFINCIVHDTTAGFSSFGANSIGQEFYGNNVFNCGWQGTPNTHGHNFYVQGPVASGGLLKYLVRNIMGGAYYANAQIYASSANEVSHFRIYDNIIIGKQGVHGRIVIGTLDGGAPNRLQDIEYYNNYAYGADLSLFQERDPNAYHSLKAYDNYLVQGKLAVSSWKNFTFTNNYIIDPINIIFGNVTIQTNDVFIPWNFDRNAYVFSAAGYTGFNLDGDGNFALAGWRTLTGYDLNSTASGSVPSGTNHIIVQNNAYDSDRAQVAVYNWTGATHVAADVSTLGWPAGTSVTIRNAQDYFLDTETVLVTSTNTIVLDMQVASHTVAVPFGASAAIIPMTFPAFGAFIMQKTAVAPPPSGTTNFTVVVSSSNPASGVPITFSPADFNGAGNGTTAFIRTNAPNVVTTMTAPSTSGAGAFSSWTFNGNFYSASPTMTFTNTSNTKWSANYVTTTRVVSVLSINPASGVAVQVAPADVNGFSNGSTSFTRTFVEGQVVTFTAPLASSDGNTFVEWRVGANPVTTSLTLNYTVTALGPFTVTAVYASPAPPPAGSSSFAAPRRGIRL